MGPLKVLVVEDDAHILRIFVRAVEHMGMTPAGASSLAEAKVLMGAMRPDLVVTDFMLGDGDGVELMHFARSIGVTAPALLVSATPPSAHATDGLFNDVIAKPFHLDTLIDALYVLKCSLRTPALSNKHRRYVGPPPAPSNQDDESQRAKPAIMARIIPKKIRKKY